MKLEKLKKLLDTHFGAPFLPENMVKTQWQDGEKKVLSIYIGRRDVQINEDGRVIAAGTFLG